MLTGCASFIHTTKADKDTLNAGISYYLPKRQHQLIVTAEHLDAAKTKTEYEKILTAHSLLAIETNKLEVQWKSLDSTAKNTPKGEAKDEATKEAQKAEGALKASKDSLKILEQALNKALKKYQLAIKPEVTPNQCDYYVTMNIQPLDLEPDTRHPFLLSVRHSPLRDDDLNIKTTASGLLMSSNVTTTDRTGDIIVEIAKAVGMIMGLPGAPSDVTQQALAEKMAKPKPKDCFPTVLTHNEIVDFAKKDSIEINFKDEYGVSLSQLNETQKYNISNLENFSVVLRDVDKESPHITKLETIYNDSNSKISWNETCELPDYKTSADCGRKNGILYRRDVPYTVELQSKPKNTSIATQQIFMPNLSPISLIPAEALQLVTAKNNMGFENGMLVSYETNQPSQVLALVSLPARVLEGYFGALTKIIKLKVDYKSAASSSAPATEAITSGTTPKD